MNERNNPTVRRESSGEGHDGVNTRAKACRSAVLFLLWHNGEEGGWGEVGVWWREVRGSGMKM